MNFSGRLGERQRDLRLWLSYVAFLIYFLVVIVPLGRNTYWWAIGKPQHAEQLSLEGWMLTALASILFTAGLVIGVLNRAADGWSPWARTMAMVLLYAFAAVLLTVARL